MRLDFDIYEFMVRSLPIHKRQTNRENLFWWSLSQINTLWLDWKDWRQNKLFEANITGQKLSIEALLNKEVTGSNNQIYIDDINDYGFYLSLESEDQDFAWFSTESENTEFVWLAKYGEVSEGLGYDFVIFVPDTAVIPEVKEIADRYVLAQMNYDIQII